MTPSASSRKRSDASVADWIASLPPAERDRQLREIAPTRQDEAALEYSWRFWGRPKQFAPPGKWVIWLVCAGRGFGKTRAGAEWVREQVEQEGSSTLRIALVGRSAADVRDTMVTGESGLMAISSPWFRPKYEPSKRLVTWPNGAIAKTFSGDEPDQLRGPQHHRAWADELAAWRYPDAWDQLMMGLRLGNDPRCIVTTTPRPTPIIRDLVDRSKDPNDVRITKGSTYENKANLATAFISTILRKYEGTRLGRQELEAEILDDIAGALWKRQQIEDLRIPLSRNEGRKQRDWIDSLGLERIVIAIDPSTTSNEESDETGIIVAGVDAQDPVHGYVLEDLSGRHPPNAWAQKAVEAYHRWEADCVIAEVNNGGDMVGNTIHTIDASVAYRAVRASKGKATRAEPVAALDEQKRIHHVGAFAELEDQMCTWVPGVSKKSPDRVDARVWAFTELMLGGAVDDWGGSVVLGRESRGRR